MRMLSSLPTLDVLLGILSDDPTARMLQISILGLGVCAVYLLFYTTRDIIIRSASIPLQLFAIFLVALLPIAGFFLYLLFRPSRTLAERETLEMLRAMSHGLRSEVAARSVRKAVHSVDVRRGKAVPIPSRA